MKRVREVLLIALTLTISEAINGVMAGVSGMTVATAKNANYSDREERDRDDP